MHARDTTAEAAAAQLAVYRRMTPAQRGEIALEMSEAARELAKTGIRMRHPDYSETEVRYALFRLLYGDALFRRAWPLAPILEP